MRPFVLDDNLKAEIKRLSDFAEAHPIPWDEFEARMNGSTPVGNDANRSSTLPFGFRMVYSIEENKDQNTGRNLWTKHLSISVDTPGRFPSIPVVKIIIGLFGFPALERCQTWIEDNRAINIVTLTDPPKPFTAAN
jgi:hypothetical protein